MNATINDTASNREPLEIDGLTDTGGHAKAMSRALRCPLLAQVLDRNLCDADTVLRIIDHPLFAQARPHFLQPLQPIDATADSKTIQLDDYRYELSPAWMIALSERFGRRYLTEQQRMELLAAADPQAWQDAFSAAKLRFISPRVRGGSKEYGCNQQYAHLLQAAANMLQSGGSELLGLFLALFRLSPTLQGHLHVTPHGFEYTCRQCVTETETWNR
ncbi:hypothetical protein KIH79_11040 [Bifidobacterium sp. 82T10]|uniref:Uncharacterized protein n=1 Tax=Bifidobacterium miconis TaxID=2834435 RepID=A0ABS6WHC2_9BIFI|nr:hypothetical protein [Bifidobacterium miconis]MBW3093444.1 hypothetical protein [Bifidobacterium miconis]